MQVGIWVIVMPMFCSFLIVVFRWLALARGTFSSGDTLVFVPFRPLEGWGTRADLKSDRLLAARLWRPCVEGSVEREQGYFIADRSG